MSSIEIISQNPVTDLFIGLISQKIFVLERTYYTRKENEIFKIYLCQLDSNTEMKIYMKLFNKYI